MLYLVGNTYNYRVKFKNRVDILKSKVEYSFNKIE